MLKSGNAVVLRTGAAALRTVTELVDTVLRPALGEAVGLVRTAGHDGHSDGAGLRAIDLRSADTWPNPGITTMRGFETTLRST